MQVRRVAGAVMLAIGLGMAAAPTGARAADEVPPLVTVLEAVTDGLTDVVNTATAGLFELPRADITSASVEYAPGWIRMKVQTKAPINPLTDKAWSDRSDAEWVLDTNGDGTPDYSVEFATADGELYGAVFDIAKPDDPSICDADSASFSPEDGYTLVIDPDCIGKPTTLGYAVAVFMDVNPDDQSENPPMATDRVPDQGFQPVNAPAQPGEAPAAAPPPAPVAPNEVPSATRGPAAAPGPGPVPDAAPGRSGQAAAPGAPAPGGPTPAPAPGNVEAAPGQPTPAPSPPGPLARTGAASERQALFGLGILMLGAGMLVMTRPTRHPVSIRG